MGMFLEYKCWWDIVIKWQKTYQILDEIISALLKVPDGKNVIQDENMNCYLLI